MCKPIALSMVGRGKFAKKQSYLINFVLEAYKTAISQMLLLYFLIRFCFVYINYTRASVCVDRGNNVHAPALKFVRPLITIKLCGFPNHLFVDIY